MRRRQFIAALPATTALSGCSTGPAKNTTETTGRGRQTTNQTVRATTVETTDRETTVSLVLRAAYRYGVNNDSLSIQAPERAQFAFVSPPESTVGSPPTAFTLALNDERITPVSSVPGYDSQTPGVGTIYTADEPEGVLMFDVPTVDPETPALVVDGDRYPVVPTPMKKLDVEKLGRAQAFTLDEIATLETVTASESVPIEITVSNEGDRAGWFLGILQTQGFTMPVTHYVSSDETLTWTVRYEQQPGYDDVETLHFSLSFADGEKTFQVAVDAETATPTPTPSPTQTQTTSDSS